MCQWYVHMPVVSLTSSFNSSSSLIEVCLCRPCLLIKAQRTCRFSQDLDLLSDKHILCRSSFAMFSERLVLEEWSLRLFFFSRVSLNLICFRIPTSNSSTLCCIPLEVSMYLQSLLAANDFPSGCTYNKRMKDWWPLGRDVGWPLGRDVPSPSFSMLLLGARCPTSSQGLTLSLLLLCGVAPSTYDYW